MTVRFSAAVTMGKQLRPILRTSGRLISLVVVIALLGRTAGAHSGSAHQPPAPDASVAERTWAQVALELAGPLCPVEQSLLRDGADGRWDEHPLLAAALVASGVRRPEVLARYQSRFDELVAELRHQVRSAGSAQAKAELAFEFLHRRILTGDYQLGSSDLREALDHGRFNCLSASILFQCLASRLGLDVRGLETPGHVSSRVVWEGGRLDIETTCSNWFRLASEPDRQGQAFGHAGRSCAVAGGPSGPAHEVPETALVGMIYYNRGVDLLAENRFAQALAANAKAVWLDPANSAARGNLLATLNNWAVRLAGAGQYAEAAALLRQGMALEPRYELFKSNYVHVHLQWARASCRQGRYTPATQQRGAAVIDRPDEVPLRRAHLDVDRRWRRTGSPPTH
ncbi:MAG TPA: hypothetical protein EYP56_12715 [Planctomycetaceae bacterium]|nr:hypothetical protein [Planctomycetaceae bacterium]